ncbi:glycosyltransferase family 4 protein [Novosphingobium terrae]|uniref:glycosyltransferase family 4 protein n=1 Tax=Novosphingobium terrae TaxID=2726189 RepID=UPI00197E2D4F|nr:glycosyltransferase [Novosphingobium terrae]
MIDNDKPVVLIFTSSFAAEIDGSHARAASLLNRLASEFSNVMVYSHKNHPSHPWTEESVKLFHSRWPSVHLVIEDFSPLLARVAAVKNLLVSLFPKRSSSILGFSAPKQSINFETIKQQAGAFIVSYKFALSELNGLDTSKCLVDTHDLLFAKWAKLSEKSNLSISALRKLRGELAALDATAGVVAISPSETSFFRMMLENSKTFYVSSWEHLSGKANRGDNPDYQFDLVFVASGYEMNVRGFLSLLKTHGQWLSRYRIAVCGQICNDPAIIEAASGYPSIQLLGFVDNIEEIYAVSKAALAPVDGTGLKIKIVSALEYGLPAFVSEQAFDGLPHGYDGAIFGIDQNIFQEILENPQHLEEAQKKAASYYDRFNAMSESDHVMAAIKNILTIPDKPRPSEPNLSLQNPAVPE